MSNVKMEKVYQRAEDKNVAARVIYVKQNDNYAYKDSACTVKFNRVELLDACVKGALIGANSRYRVPIQFGYDTNIENPDAGFWTMVQYPDLESFSSSDSTMVLKAKSIFSEEYSAS